MFKHLGLALRVLRELKGVNQAGLARRAGVGKSQLSKYENGKELPKLDSLARLLSALETQPLALFYLDDLLARLKTARPCDALLMSTDFGPLLSGAEKRAFDRVLQDILELFKANIENRMRGTANET